MLDRLINWFRGRRQSPPDELAAFEARLHDLANKGLIERRWNDTTRQWEWRAV